MFWKKRCPPTPPISEAEITLEHLRSLIKMFDAPLVLAYCQNHEKPWVIVVRDMDNRKNFLLGAMWAICYDLEFAEYKPMRAQVLRMIDDWQNNDDDDDE